MAATSVALNTLLRRSLPPRFHVPASLAACATVSALAAKSGAGLEEQGLSLSRLPRGCLYGLAAAAPIVAALGAGLYFKRMRTFYRADHIAGSTTGPVAYEALFRIPFGTALSEEVIFRGALLAVLSRYHREPVTTAISSLLFGLWHIAPTLSQIDAVSGKPPLPKAALVARSVGITAAAGFVLAWLRHRSGSIAAPWIAHGAANATGYAGVRLAARLTPRGGVTPLRGS
jgi:membrane protease YdiL (CAAX protease family)